MRDVWEDSWPSFSETTIEEGDEVTWQYLPAHRRTTEPCPLCGMRNALSHTELVLGYLCEDCARE